MRNILLTTLFLTVGICVTSAQNVFYKSNFLYAHTFENGLNDGIYQNAASMDCITYVGMTSPSVGGPDPTIPTITAESTGSILQDDSFDAGGVNARCFPQVNEKETTAIASQFTVINNFSITLSFSADAEVNVEGLYFEAGQVNMSGLFQTNSIAKYRVLVHNGGIVDQVLFASEVLETTDTWNRFYVPFMDVNTLDWSGKDITFEVRFWNDGQGHPFFRLDDIALIGNTACDRGVGRVGNLVWNDANKNGVVDNGESGIPNVTVKLYQDDGDGSFDPDPNTGDGLISIKTTDASGRYEFKGVPDGNLFVVVGNENFGTGNGLEGYFPTTGTAVGANSDTDETHHGVVSTIHRINGVQTDALNFTAGTEPTNDGDDANGNMTIDFGFYTEPTVAIGNLVWEERVVDGSFDTGDGEIGISGVKLQLYEDTDASGDYTTGDVLIDRTITDGLGNYLFSGLINGDYIVEVPISNFDLGTGVLAGFNATNGSPVTDPDDNINDDSEGGFIGASLYSNAITVETGVEPITDGDTNNHTNLTVDFGFMACDVKARILWQNTIGGNSIDFGNVVIQTSDGGYLIGGGSQSGISGDKTEVNQGSYDYWVAKTNELGVIQWNKTIGGTGSESVMRLVETSDGYVLAGTSNSGISGDKTEASNGANDFWIVKINTSGTVLWQNSIGGSGNDYLLAFEQNSDGTFVAGGRSASGISGDKTEAQIGGDDYWMVKLSSTGTVLWDKTYGGTANERMEDLKPTSDGGYILGGYSSSGVGGNKTMASFGGEDYWTVKTDGLGNITWQTAIGGTGRDEMKSIYQTSDGGYICGGYSSSTVGGNKTVGTYGGYDYYLVKLNSVGGIEWQNNIGGTASDTYRHMNLTSDGGFIMGAFTTSGVGGDKTEANQGSLDIWLVKADANGQLEWEKNIGTSGIDQFGKIQETADGNFIVSGTSNGGIDGDKTEASQGSYDYWLLKVAPPLENNCSDLGSLSIGNLVWEDTNQDASVNGTESGITNVRVDLFLDNGDGIYKSTEDTYLFTQQTDANGNYQFDDLAEGDYFLCISPENFTGGIGALDGMTNSPMLANGNSDTNESDHGTDTPQAAQFGVISTFVTLTENSEPNNDGDMDQNTNLTIDFGFFTPPAIMKIGNLIFEDKNNNSFLDAGEMGIPNVTVELYQDADGDEMLNTSIDKYIADDITDPSGIYGFENLAPGKYFLNIPVSNWSGSLSGMKNSTAFGGNDFDFNNDDAGVEEMHYDEENQGVASSVLTLEYNAEPDVAVDGDDKFGNMSVDFGFYQEVKIGNLVWEDTDNDGVKSGTENPIGGIMVDLFVDTDKNGIFDKNTDAYYWSTFTDATTGEYEFDRLGEDDYFVRVNPRNFKEGKPLRELMTSIVSVNGNSDTNENNHGTDYDSYQIEGVRSTVITLVPTNEPTNDGDDDSSNSTVDFGFVPSRICGVAWEDVNEDGLFDGGDSHLEGVTVKLIEDPSGKVLDITTTAADGTYSFGVPTGNYIIEFDETTNTSGIIFGSGTIQNTSGTTLTDTNDSDIDLMTGKTTVFSFDTGDQDCNIDGGFSRNPLPVEMLYFNAHENDCVTEIRWATAAEENNSHFVVEKSDDGSRFTEIGRVEGAGNSVETIKYEFFDKDMTTEKMYYRIKQVDFDGTYAYTDVEVVKLGRNSKCLTELGKGTLYPNPNRGQFTFQIELENELPSAIFSVKDILGRTIHMEEMNLEKGESRVNFDLKNYSAGTYFLTVRSADGNEMTYRFVLVDEN